MEKEYKILFRITSQYGRFKEKLLRLWKIANKFQLNYIISEGVAINLHAYQRSMAEIHI